ncbi:MAG: V-type ATP synthase subunit I, partial [Ligilactobacillus ruminis]
MSIIRMQKVAVLGLDADKKRLMSELMDLGVVELTDCSAMSGEDFRNVNLTQDGAPETVELFEKKVFDAAQALEVLEKYGEIKEPLFHTRRRAKIDKLLNLAEKIKNASDRINRMESDTAMLTPWKSFDLSLAERGTQTTDITLGVIPKTDFRSFSEVTEKLQSASAEGENAEAMQYCMIKQVSEDKDYMYAALVTGKEETKAVMMQLREIGFSELNLSAFAGTADENLKQLNKEKQEAEDYADYFTVEADKERSREKLLRTSKTFLLEGWLPVRTKARVTQILDENNACYQFRDPEEGEEVPVLLENKSFFQPTEAITEMYSLPSYWGFDPTSIYSLFYIIFFGMMFSDAGYGLLLAIGCGVILKKFDLEGTTFKMIKLFFYCGISTTVWGVLFGGFFGDLIGVFSNTFLGKQIAFNAVWFNPLEDPMKLLIFSLILGVIHLFIGMGIQAYMQIKDRKIVDAVCDEGFWYLTILGLCAWLCGSAAFDSAVLSTAGMWMSIAGAIGLLIAGGRGRKGIGKIVGGFSNLYNIT